jgi:AhpD family alkylhydroperoxidase
LRGALAIHEVFSKSSLSSVEQQLVMIAVSVANDCEYCVAAHSNIAKRLLQVDPALIDALRRRAPLADARLEALATFTRTVVEQRGWIADLDVAAFLDAGYTRAQVIEVLFGIGMKTFNNYVDHIAHTPLNEQFKDEAWQIRHRVA